MKENKEKLASWHEWASFTLDWEKLADYRDPVTHMPIHCMLNLYEVLGVVTAIKKAEVSNIVALDNLFCNANTQKKIHDFILDNWRYYNLTIEGDEDVRWKEGQPQERRKFAHKPTARAKASVETDYLTYCPGVDDEMDDNVISLGQMVENIKEIEA